MATDTAAAKILEMLRGFAAEHPELAADAAHAIEAGAASATPVRLYTVFDVFRKIIDDGLFGGDVAMIEKAHAAIDRHEAEHQALVAGDPVPEPEDVAPSRPPVPASPPVPANLPGGAPVAVAAPVPVAATPVPVPQAAPAEPVAEGAPMVLTADQMRAFATWAATQQPEARPDQI